MLYIVKILPFTPDSNSNSMHAIYIQNWYTGKHTWQVSVQVYIYISSMAYKTVLQTLETMKLGKNGGG